MTDTESDPVVQVETETAVDGVDALFVGPTDLSTSLGAPVDYDDESFRATVTSRTAAARASDTPAGSFSWTLTGSMTGSRWALRSPSRGSTRSS